VFFAFSTFVMQGLVRAAHPHGLIAMQAINVTAVTPVFMTALFGTAAACVYLVIVGLSDNTAVAVRPWLVVGSASYLIGAIGTTVVFNVPLNNQLAAIDPSAGNALFEWGRYARAWTAWNHVRTLACLAAAGLLTMARITQQG
jgi:uncharacterized membrane protein